MKIDIHTAWLHTSILAAALCLPFLILWTGCPGRRLPFFTARTEVMQEEEPRWVFERQGLRTYEDQDVVLVVGVDARAIDYQGRRQNALELARKRLEKEIFEICSRIGGELIKGLEFQPPEAELVSEIFSDFAAEFAEKLANRTDPVSTYESMLRREVFVKLILPVEKIIEGYFDMAEGRIETRLGDELRSGELESLLEEISVRLQ